MDCVVYIYIIYTIYCLLIRKSKHTHSLDGAGCADELVEFNKRPRRNVAPLIIRIFLVSGKTKL